MILLSNACSAFAIQICAYLVANVFTSQKLTASVSKICIRVGKPSNAHSEALRELFPSSSSSSKRIRLSDAFDPTQPCVALEYQKKKKAVCCRPSKVTVIVVEDLRKGLPKRKYRKEFAQLQRVVSLEFYRYMSSTQIKNAIIRGFEHLPLRYFKYLVCDGKVSLVVNADQDQDGNKIINSLQPGKGTLYLLECQEVSLTIHMLHNSIYCCT